MVQLAGMNTGTKVDERDANVFMAQFEKYVVIHPTTVVDKDHQ